MYARKRAARRLLHHKAHRLGKALEVPLHLAQHICFRVERTQLDRHAVEISLQRLRLFLPGFQAKRIARNPVFCRLHTVCRVFQRLDALRPLLFGLCAARFVRLQILLQGLFPRLDLFHRRSQGRNLRLFVLCVRQQKIFLRRALQKRLLRCTELALHLACLRGFLLHLRIELRARLVQRGNCLLPVFHRFGNRAASCRLLVHFAPGTLDVLLQMLHLRLQNRHVRLFFLPLRL